MKYLLLSLTAVCLFLGSVNAQNQEIDRSQDLPVDHGMAEQYTGTFESKRGVMDPISCHGFHIGYFETEEGNRFVICFDRLPGGEDLKTDCENDLWIQGYTEEHTANSNGSCPGSKRNIFYVTEWHCR